MNNLSPQARIQRNAAIVKAYDARTEMISDIADRYGISVSRVIEIARRAGCERRCPKIKLSEAQKADVVAKLNRGLPMSHCFPDGMDLRRRSFVRDIRPPDAFRNNAWSAADDAVIAEHYGKGRMSASDIAKAIGRTRNEVIGRANRIGLKAKFRVVPMKHVAGRADVAGGSR